MLVSLIAAFHWARKKSVQSKSSSRISKDSAVLPVASYRFRRFSSESMAYANAISWKVLCAVSFSAGAALSVPVCSAHDSDHDRSDES